MVKSCDVVFVTDAGYILPTTVAITSLILNANSSVEYKIHILTNNLKKNEEKLIEEAVKNRNNISYKIHTCSLEIDLPEEHNEYIVANKTALLKFKIPSTIQSDCAVYLDSDIILKGDISEICAYEIKDKYAAVVRDLPQTLFEKQLLGGEINGRDYFNSGVMLLNLKKMREDNIEKKLIETKLNLKSRLMDQDVFNIVFGKNVIQLPPKFNICFANLSRSLNKYYTINQINELYGTKYTTLEDTLKECIVIHYSSNAKPWIFFDVPLANEWLKYLYQSPCKNYRIHRTTIKDNETKYKQCVKDLQEKNKTQYDSKIVPIALCTDYTYAPYAAVAIQSIIDTAKSNWTYDVFVLHNETLSMYTRKRLSDMSTDKVNVSCIDITLLTEEVNKLYSRAHYSLQMYYRWYIPEILTQYDKVIYVDCDMIVKEDLLNLYNIPMEDNIIAAVNNYMGKKNIVYAKEKLKLKPEQYINSGLLCIKNKLFITENIKEKGFEVVKNNKELWCPDQDAISIACRGRIKILPDTWNYQWHHLWPKYRMELDTSYKDRVIAASFKPKIIHYTAAEKPWWDPSKPYSDEFWKCARKTSFYEEIIYINTSNKTQSIVNKTKNNTKKASSFDKLLNAISIFKSKFNRFQ